jgi:hypothetical protein
MLRKIRNYFFLFIRIALIASVVINAAIVFIDASNNTQRTIAEAISLYTGNFESIFFALVTLALSFGSDIIEKRQKIDIPDILEIIILIFVYAGIFLSTQFNLYYRYFWWDDLLHTFSGIIIGFIGFIVAYKINHRYSMDISPVLIALFAYTFAVTLGVLWEILEFSADVLTGSAHQKWDLPETEILMGKSYQGNGLRDTMSDLIVDNIGAFITSLITYYMYKHRKKRVLDEMQKMILPPE